MIAAQPTENSRVTLSFAEEWKDSATGKWVYKNPERPHYGSDRSPWPGSDGRPIFAAFAATVLAVKLNNGGCGNTLELSFSLPFRAVSFDVAGKMIILPKDKPLWMRYCHCQDVLVQAGQIVAVGQQVATIGKTGFAKGAHLHWEIASDGIKVNPEMVLEQAMRFTDTETLKSVRRDVVVFHLPGLSEPQIMRGKWIVSDDGERRLDIRLEP